MFLHLLIDIDREGLTKEDCEIESEDEEEEEDEDEYGRGSCPTDISGSLLSPVYR